MQTSIVLLRFFLATFRDTLPLRKRKNATELHHSRLSLSFSLPWSSCIRYIDSSLDAARAACPCYFVQRSDGRQTDVNENRQAHFKAKTTNRQPSEQSSSSLRSICVIKVFKVERNSNISISRVVVWHKFPSSPSSVISNVVFSRYRNRRLCVCAECAQIVVLRDSSAQQQHRDISSSVMAHVSRRVVDEWMCVFRRYILTCFSK